MNKSDLQGNRTCCSGRGGKHICNNNMEYSEITGKNLLKIASLMHDSGNKQKMITAER